VKRRHNCGYRDEKSPKQLLIEVIVFYMHTVDRAAFYHLGVTKRDGFIDRFFAAVMSEVRKCLKKQSSAEDFIGTLEETLERRQHEYATYRAYFPTNDESPESTLGWGFTKVISELIDQGQDSLTDLYSLIGRVSATVLEAPDLEEVFRDYEQRAAPTQ
jgi:hypothetical protein